MAYPPIMGVVGQPQINVNNDGLFPSESGELFGGSCCVWVCVMHPRKVANRAMIEIEHSFNGENWQRHSLIPRAHRYPIRYVVIVEPKYLRVRVSDFIEPFQIAMEQR
jgi:hypothetical protein